MKQVKTQAAFDAAIAAPELTVVDFSATWCGPCKAIAPYVSSLADEYTDVNFVKVDIDQLEGVAAAYGVRGVPTFVFFRSGQALTQFSGANKAKLLQTVRKHALAAAAPEADAGTSA